MFYARNTKNHRNCITLMEAKENLEFIVFDTETTGIDTEKDYIVELAALKYKVCKKKPELIEKLDLYIRPPFFMDDKVVAIHGITNEFLQDKPTEAACFSEIQKFFGCRPILVAYNADFDIGMMQSLYKKCGAEFRFRIALDVREMGYDLIQGKDVENHKLGTLVSILGLDVDLQFHNALDDAVATFRLLMYCYQEYKKRTINPTPQKVYVNAIYFWKGFRKEQSGVYLKTNLGNIYFSTYTKLWCSSQVDLSLANIDEMENDVLNRTGLTFKEFGKMTEKKFATMKTELRQKGVYL